MARGLRGLRGVVCFLLPAMALADPAPLTGVVVDEQGLPVEGARVVIWTGDPIHDVPLLCPSCYADCGRIDKTDEDGVFVFEDADDAISFRLVVIAQGCHPLHTTSVAPGGAPRTFTVRARPALADTSRLVGGRVVDAQGRPVADAMVRPIMWWFGPGRRGGSHLEGSDPFAFTDADGRFEIVAGAPVHGASLRIEGPLLTPAYEDLVRSGLPVEARPVFTLHTGVTIKGRLLDTSGEPLPGVELQASSLTQGPGRAYVATIGTGEGGAFEFVNVPAESRVVVTGNMEALRGLGVVRPISMRTGANDGTTDLGMVRLERGLTVRGRVVMGDGQPLPAGGRKAYLSANADSQRVDIADDGSFVFESVPRGEASVSIQVPGYHVSRWNPSRDQFNTGLVGTLEHDLDALDVLLEPGPDPRVITGHDFASGRQRPALSGDAGLGARAHRVLGQWPTGVRVEPGAPVSAGWPDAWPFVTIVSPVGTSPDNPRVVRVRFTDPTRPTLPASTTEVLARGVLENVYWPAELADARVLRVEASAQGTEDALLMDPGGPVMRQLILDAPSAADCPGAGHASLGRVLDASGRPVAGAVVVAQAYWKLTSGQFPWPGGTHATRTDDKGHFAITADKPYDRVQVRVRRPGHADHIADLIPDASRLDVMVPGSTRLTLAARLADGTAASGVVGTLWRRSEEQRWSILAASYADQQGRLVFEHAPAGEALQVVIGGGFEPGAIWPAVEVEPLKEGAPHDAGVFEAGPGATITGQLMAIGQASLHERPALVLHRLSTNERLTTHADEGGAFAFGPVPPGEAYALSLHGPAFIHSAMPGVVHGFTIGASAIGGVLGGDTHLPLLVEVVPPGATMPPFAGQARQSPMRGFGAKGPEAR